MPGELRPAPLATDIRYDRHGRVSQVTHGNGVVEQVGAGAYGMARPSYHRTQGALGARGASGNWDSGTYSYDGAGNVKAMGTSRFAYDALSRLTEGRVRVGGSDFVQEVDFDAFGNITEVTSSTFPPRVTETSTSTNHLTSGTYNPAGSLTSWNLWSYAWDPVEMMKRRSTSGQDWRHVYTAGDERFWNVNISDWETSDFALRDLDGKVLRVYEADGGKWSRFTDYVWRGDALLARDFSHTRPEAFHLDHLGTPRLLTNHRAERLAQPNYYPFGEEITVNTQVAERLKFTGHERDTLGSPEVADDLDYMHARFANPITGRFLSVDPARESADATVPQSWNRYAYTLSNPLLFVDPDGRLRVRANDLAQERRPGMGRFTYQLGFTGRPEFFLEKGLSVAKWASKPLSHLHRARKAGSAYQDALMSRAAETSVPSSLLSAWQVASLESAIRSSFESGTGHLTGPHPRWDLADLRYLQEVVDRVLASFVKAEKLTKAQADALRAIYDIERLRVQAESGRVWNWTLPSTPGGKQ